MSEMLPLDESIMVALMCGETIGSAATIAGCSYATVQRHMARPYFKDEMERRLKEGRREAMRKIQSEVWKSLLTLSAIRDDQDAPHGVRVKAATELLDRAGVIKLGADMTSDSDEATPDEESVGEWLSEVASELEDA